MQKHFTYRNLFVIFLNSIRVQGIRKGFGKYGIKIKILPVCPIGTAFAPPQHSIIHCLHFHYLIDLLLNIIVHIQDKSRLLTFRKSIPMHCRTLCRSQFGFYPVCIQKNRIISRFGIFLFMRKSRCERTLLAFCSQKISALHTYSRHQQEISEIRTPGTTKTCMGKAIDRSIFIIISGTGIPTVNTSIWSRLYHAMGNHSTRMGMSMASCTNKRVDIMGVIIHFIALRITCGETQ